MPRLRQRVELFSTDLQQECGKYGIVYNNIQSCILWCSKARECVGDEMYEKLRIYRRR